MRTILLKCKPCGHMTKHNKDGISLLAGFLLTVLTGGLFIPIWALMFIFGTLFKRWHCENCGAWK